MSTKHLLEAAEDTPTQRQQTSRNAREDFNRDGKWNGEIPSILASKSDLICSVQFSTPCGIFVGYSFSIPINSSTPENAPQFNECEEPLGLRRGRAAQRRYERAAEGSTAPVTGSFSIRDAFLWATSDLLHEETLSLGLWTFQRYFTFPC